MVPNSNDTIDWEPKHPCMKYVDTKRTNKECHEFLKNMMAMDIESDPFDTTERVIKLIEAEALVEEISDSEFPLDVHMFKTHQHNDTKLQQRVSKAIKNGSKVISLKKVEGVDLLHENNKIIVPNTLKQRVLDWYHDMLVHPGEKRMENSIRAIYTWPGLRQDVHHECKTCDICQCCKRSRKKKYGLLPEKEAEITKWSQVNVDLWGPKTIANKNGWEYEIHVMTMIDPVTGWFEQQQLYGSPTAYRCQQIFDSVWLSRYPRPKEIGFDNGGEFKAEFAQLCRNMGIKPKTSLPIKCYIRKSP